MALDLNTLKAHCNVTGNDDNAVLTRILSAAIYHVESELGLVLNTIEGGIPGDLEQAVLMVAAHWYENREGTLVGVAAHTLPIGVPEIIANHRNYTFAAPCGQGGDDD